MDPKQDNMVEQNALEREEEDKTTDWTTEMLKKKDMRDKTDREG